MGPTSIQTQFQSSMPPPHHPPADQSAMDMLTEYAAIAWRRKWVIGTSLLVSMTLAIAYCLLAPKLYRSETLILVEDPKLPTTYVQGVVEGNLEQRIFLIQKQVTSRGLLVDVVKELNLYPLVAEMDGLDAAAAMLANSIKVEMVTPKEMRGNFGGRTGIDAFTISFLHESPEIAMQATARIAEKFIQENLKYREETAESNTEFLDAEVQAVKADLERREEEISRFKSDYLGELPQQMEVHLRALDRLSTEIMSVDDGVHRTTERLSLIESAIQEYKRFGKTTLAKSASAYEPDPLFRRHRELREKLVQLQSEFWDAYPEVILTKDQLRNIEQELVEQYGPNVLKGGENSIDPYLQDLRKQRSELKSELFLLKKRRTALLADQKEKERRIERAPEVEQRLLILERDYQNVKNSYSTLLEKRLNARVVENLEKQQQGSQFRIVDVANFPRSPAFPNQRRILFLGFILGSAVGFGIAFVQEVRSPQFRVPEDIEQMRGPQLLAVIPEFSFELNRMTKAGAVVNASLGGANDSSAGPPSSLRRWERLMKQGRKPQEVPRDLSFVTRLFPNSLMSEQYRVAATRLTLRTGDNQSTVVAITSAVKGEGKTTTVINLGYTLARDLGKRTLIMDCDFSCPFLSRYTTTLPPWGLADLLMGDAPLDDCLGTVGDVPCWIMPVGQTPFSASDLLLKAERFSHILDRCRTQFDYVLINTPPILPLATMNMLEQRVDLLLLVVRAAATSQMVVRRALNSLGTNRPIHVILNAVETRSLPYYMYSRYPA